MMVRTSAKSTLSVFTIRIGLEAFCRDRLGPAITASWMTRPCFSCGQATVSPPNANAPAVVDAAAVESSAAAPIVKSGWMSREVSSSTALMTTSWLFRASTVWFTQLILKNKATTCQDRLGTEVRWKISLASVVRYGIGGSRWDKRTLGTQLRHD